jgi:hypothetical protein
MTKTDYTKEQNFRFDLRWMSIEELVKTGLSMCSKYNRMLESKIGSGMYDKATEIVEKYRKMLGYVRSELRYRQKNYKPSYEMGEILAALEECKEINSILKKRKV